MNKIMNKSIYVILGWWFFSLMPVVGQGTFCVYNSEEEFKSAIGILHQPDDFSDMTNIAFFDMVSRKCGPCGYSCLTYSNNLIKTQGELAAGFPLDTMYITNSPKAIHYIGGYFYNTDAMGQFSKGTITIKAGGNTYSFTPTNKDAFMGFVFSQPVTEVSFSGGAINLMDDKSFTMSHLYLGAPAVNTTNASIPDKTM